LIKITDKPFRLTPASDSSDIEYGPGVQLVEFAPLEIGPHRIHFHDLAGLELVR